MDLIQQPLVQGLAAGLVFSLVVFFYGWSNARGLRKQLSSKEKALAEAAEALTKAKDSLTQENKKLQERNSTLEATTAKLLEKPSKDEIRMLFIYETALKSMNIRVLGFPGAWDKAMIEAQEELKQVKGGLAVLVRNVVRPLRILKATPQSSQTPLINPPHEE
ncbi:MAG: hypothetical protein RLZZ214_2485 [Verrucomicrobiota bacterium]|jgi:cell division protein FtsB